MSPKQFAQEHYAKKSVQTANEEALRDAIEQGRVKPGMSLREIGSHVGIENPQLVRHYLQRFLKDGEAEPPTHTPSTEEETA